MPRGPIPRGEFQNKSRVLSTRIREDTRKALEEAGAGSDLVSPSKGKVKGWNHTEWGDEFAVDVPLESANSEDYDAIVLPGGVINPDRLRINTQALDFVRAFADAGKPIAAICHGPWTLINAGLVRDREMTSWPSIELDLRNAGARWVDREVVVDNGLITSRKPDDIPAFNRKMIEEFAEGIHPARRDTASASSHQQRGATGA